MGRRTRRKRDRRRKPLWWRESYYDMHHVPPRRWWKEGDLLLRMKRNKHVAYHVLFGAPRTKSECAERMLIVLEDFWPGGVK